MAFEEAFEFSRSHGWKDGKCGVKPSGLAILLPQASVHGGAQGPSRWTAFTGTGFLATLKAQLDVCSVWGPSLEWSPPVLPPVHPGPVQEAGQDEIYSGLCALPPGPAEAAHR